jgi:putative ABC transport system substrate-binding protein
VAGRDLVVERRYAEGRFEKLDTLAAELVKTGPDVIVSIAVPAILAARRATSAIPIVFYGNFDPLASGVVASLARPGGNVTGVLIAPDGTLAAKRLELLAEFVPKARRIAFLASGDRASMELQVGEARKAAEKLGIDMPVVAVTNGDYNEAFANIAALKANGLFVAGSSFFMRDRATIIALAAKHRLPATYEWREHVESGGLMSYGTSLAVTTARTADFVDRIFRGAKPADMPVEQPTGFELSLNIKTARSLGLKPAPALLMRAQTVIE